MRPIEYQLPKRKQPVYACVKFILRFFYRKARTVVLGEPLQDKCVYLANHANKNGPLMYELYFPVYNVKWGAHQMLGTYKERKAYLRDVLYIQKNGMGKTHAAIKAGIEAIFSKYLYRGMKMVPTYSDMRLAKTVRKSVDILNADSAIMIFPENSNEGYNDEITEFFSGFELVLESYYKKNGSDVPVRCLYYHAKKRLMVVGENFYLQDLFKQGYDRNTLAEFMKDQVNGLYRRIESGEFDRKKGKNK